MKMVMGALLLAGSLCATSWLAGADDKKDEPVKVKGFLPQNWGKIGLSVDQKQDIYKIQSKYSAEIDKLKAKIEELRTKQKAEMEKVLTEDQKKKLKEIRTGEKTQPDTTPKSK